MASLLLGTRNWDIVDTLWWSGRIARTVRLEDGDIRLVYKVDKAPTPLPRVDRLGRTALEAFTAIPFTALLDRATTNVGARRGRPQFPELSNFVNAFGPIGADWGSEVEIDPTPPELAAPVELRARETGPSWMNSIKGPTSYWVAKLDGPGLGRTGRAFLERRHRLPGAALRIRARYDDSLPSDRLGRLAAEGRVLTNLIDLASAIAANDRTAAKAAFEAMPGFDGLVVPLGGRSHPTPWAGAHLGPRPFDGNWIPSRPPRGADWLALGGRWLAATIDQRLRFTSAGIVPDSTTGFRLVQRPGSLLDVIYGQFYSQLQRLDFGFGVCVHCRGCVIRTRRPGPKAKRWHSGCKEVGRKREQREQAAVAR